MTDAVVTNLDEIVARALAEDVGAGDVTGSGCSRPSETLPRGTAAQGAGRRLRARCRRGGLPCARPRRRASSAHLGDGALVESAPASLAEVEG